MPLLQRKVTLPDEYRTIENFPYEGFLGLLRGDLFINEQSSKQNKKPL